jgi:hypothetical protein
VLWPILKIYLKYFKLCQYFIIDFKIPFYFKFFLNIKRMTSLGTNQWSHDMTPNYNLWNTTNTNVSNPNLNIHNFKKNKNLMDPSKVKITCFSIDFANTIRNTSSMKCFWFGNTIWRFYLKIKCYNIQWLSIVEIKK